MTSTLRSTRARVRENTPRSLPRFRYVATPQGAEWGERSVDDDPEFLLLCLSRHFSRRQQQDSNTLERSNSSNRCPRRSRVRHEHEQCAVAAFTDADFLSPRQDPTSRIARSRIFEEEGCGGCSTRKIVNAERLATSLLLEVEVNRPTY